MKNYRKSDYALNKFSEGIVYQFSDGTVEISLADYLRDNPGKTGRGRPLRHRHAVTKKERGGSPSRPAFLTYAYPTLSHAAKAAKTRKWAG